MAANIVESRRPCELPVSHSGSPNPAEARPGPADAVNQVEQLACRPAEPIELGDDNNVTSAQASHELGKLRAIGPDARDLFPIDRMGSGSLKGLKLTGQLLAPRRHSAYPKTAILGLLFRNQVPQTLTH